MIVTDLDGQLRIVTQPDHARLAAEILSLWRADGLPEHPRRDELLLAAREHDNGWQEADAAPHVDAQSGLPADFRQIPESERLRIWKRGAARIVDEEPYVAALVTKHAIEIHRDRAGQPPWDAFIEEKEARLAELLAQAVDAAPGPPAPDLESDYAWIELSDLLSLAACGALPGPHSLRGHAFRAGPNGIEIEPFPLAGATTFQLPTRTIPRRRYRYAVDLAGALATARWERTSVRVAPFSA